MSATSLAVRINAHLQVVALVSFSMPSYSLDSGSYSFAIFRASSYDLLSLQLMRTIGCPRSLRIWFTSTSTASNFYVLFMYLRISLKSLADSTIRYSREFPVLTIAWIRPIKGSDFCLYRSYQLFNLFGVEPTCLRCLFRSYTFWIPIIYDRMVYRNFVVLRLSISSQYSRIDLRCIDNLVV